jgi:signal transduction histidine kinase
VLDQLGLAAALAWQASDFQSHTGILCHITRPEEVSVTAHRATALFRIFQEVLTNITRHSGATEVQVALREDQEDLVLEITDNGCGFSKEEASPKSRFGLVGMRERALAVGGEVEVSSTPGRGTKVCARVPRSVPP